MEGAYVASPGQGWHVKDSGKRFYAVGTACTETLGEKQLGTFEELKDHFVWKTASGRVNNMEWDLHLEGQGWLNMFGFKCLQFKGHEVGCACSSRPGVLPLQTSLCPASSLNAQNLQGFVGHSKEFCTLKGFQKKSSTVCFVVRWLLLQKWKCENH